MIRLSFAWLNSSTSWILCLLNSDPSVKKNLLLYPSPGKWSKKQIIGHLIDSATNNHHRFVRAQFHDKPTILYEQELWNQHSYYQSMRQEHMISFWEKYNRHIVELTQRIPAELLSRECMMSDGNAYPIRWVFEDYVRHMEHHLRQVFKD
jgi:hypothetical protein